MVKPRNHRQCLVEILQFKGRLKRTIYICIFLITFFFLRDSATRTFGLFFLGALAMVTIGAGIGIGVGNLAHYRNFNISHLGYTLFNFFS
jgi:hypothetical protein